MLRFQGAESQVTEDFFVYIFCIFLKETSMKRLLNKLSMIPMRVSVAAHVGVFSFLAAQNAHADIIDTGIALITKLQKGFIALMGLAGLLAVASGLRNWIIKGNPEHPRQQEIQPMRHIVSPILAGVALMILTYVANQVVGLWGAQTSDIGRNL